MELVPKALALAATALLLAACASPGPPATPGAGTPMTQKQIAQALATDPCPLRLQDISDAMLLYFSYHNRTLPKSLEELQAYTKQSSGAELLLTCPASGQPFAYIPEGLQVEGQPWILFVYDADNAHHGIHWAIVAPTQSNHPATVTMRVVPMDDHTLQTYLDTNLIHS